MSELATRRSRLTAAQRALLAKRLRGQESKAAGQSPAALPTLEPDSAAALEPFPLLDAQALLWRGRNGERELGGVSPHVYLEAERSELDLARFESTFQALVRRHPMLRAVVRDGRQVVLGEVPDYTVKVFDLREETPVEQERRLSVIRERMSHSKRCPDSWPLFEVRVTRLAADRFRIHADFDLLPMDLPSLEFLCLEWRKLYEGQGLPDVPFAFRDYAITCERFKSAELYRRSLKHWQERLPQLPPAPDLPLARDPRSITRPRFVRWAAEMPAAEWGRIKECAAAEGLTPSVVLMAAFGDVLAVAGAGRRFTLGSTLFNRLPVHPRVMEVLGQYTSTSLTEVDVDAHGTFLDRCRHLQEQLWKDLEHGYVDASALLAEQRRKAGEDRPVTPVIFTSALAHFEEAGDVPPTRWLGEPCHAVAERAETWMEHLVLENAGTLEYSWDVVEELFPDHLISNLFDLYGQALERLAESAEVWTRRADPMDLWPSATVLASC